LFKSYLLHTLTSRKYWEDYNRSSTTEKAEITRICSRYDDLFNMLVEACKQPLETTIELGAYPGRFLIYLSAKYSLEATALDFNSDTSKIVDSLTSMGDVIDYLKSNFIH